ncbi:MAG: D-alanyl-D-alanine carboxypeptidase [Butyrivibrio sp.]|nr:D-alanyl-D-alanine carboxypeptidase [Acetatifactor muris]MCM1560475.1 D-alanyl-D-alanine carboxypeptidase [Butyrivibrio sp.]
MYSKKVLAALLLAAVLWVTAVLPANANISVSSPSAILIESSTGQVIYESNATERRSLASVTKVMTLLLTFEALDEGKVKLTDDVLTSEYASSMGGSQVFLAQGEVQSLETMIKCIVIASGNDASVAVAEHVAGSEETFVEMMNEKALELGMVDTHFVDCCGLTDSEDHYSCARDIAVMSRELTVNHPEIFNYTKIWMEDITHVTPQGTSSFTLSSTNKLLKQYQYTTGLKTGFTSKAKYCISATASKDGIDLIAVVMGAPDSKTRSGDVQTLMTYGFGICRLYIDENADTLNPLTVKGGVEDKVSLKFEGEFRYLDTQGSNLAAVEKVVDLPESVQAPAEEGGEAGRVRYYLDGSEIGSVPILYAETVEKAGFTDYMKKVLGFFLL